MRCVKFHKSADLVYIWAEAFNHALYTLTFTLLFNSEVNTGVCIRRDVLSVTLVRSQFKRSCIAGGGVSLFTGLLALNCYERTKIKDVFDNGVLRGIFGPEKEEIACEWRKLSGEETQRYAFIA